MLAELPQVSYQNPNFTKYYSDITVGLSEHYSIHFLVLSVQKKAPLVLQILKY